MEIRASEQHFMKHLAIALFVTLLLANTEARAVTVEQINATVEQIDKRISAQELPSIEANYDYKDATEGAPPSFSFFFDVRTSKLVACIVSVGHETWVKQFYYYFDENEKIIKYLEVIPPSDAGPATSRTAIIYDGNGKVLWKDIQAPRQMPNSIKTLYKSLSKAADAFARY
jgi:hypothetical protein